MKNRILAYLCAFALLLSASVCAEGLTVVDMAGRESVFSAPVTRVVALDASDCEILFALGAQEMLVGRGEYCDYPAEALSVPSVQSGYEMNIEQIIALNPQAVILPIMGQTKEQNAQLEAAGIRAVISDAQDIEGIYKNIAMLGALTDKNAEAEALIASMKADLARLSEDADRFAGKTVYFEVSPLQYGLWTAGKGTFMNEAAELLGLTNCFGDVDGWAAVSEEQVLARNPDYIVTISPSYGVGLTPVEEIITRPGWNGVTAVKNAAILNLPNDELSRPAPRLVDGVRLLRDFVAGE